MHALKFLITVLYITCDSDGQNFLADTLKLQVQSPLYFLLLSVFSNWYKNQKFAYLVLRISSMQKAGTMPIDQGSIYKL